MGLFALAVVFLSALIGLASLKRRGFAFGLMLSTYATEQLLQSQLSWFAGHSAIVNIGFAMVVCVAILLGDHRVLTHRTKVTNAVILFMAYMGFATAWSPDWEFATGNMFSAIPYLVSIGILGPLCIQSRDDLLDFLKVTAIYGGIICLGVSLTSYRGGRLVLMLDTGDLGYANYLATGSYGGIVFLSAAGLAILAKKWWRLVFIAAGLCGAMALFKSTARGATIGVGLALLAMAWHTRMRDKMSSVRSLAVILAFSFAVIFSSYFAETRTFTVERWMDKSFGTQYAVQSRWSAVERLFEVYLSRPTSWPLGLGTASSYYFNDNNYCHVVPVEVLIELGLVGLFLYSMIFYFCWQDFSALSKKMGKSSDIRVIAAIMFSLLLLQMFLQLKQGNARSISELVAMAILISNRSLYFHPTAKKGKTSRQANETKKASHSKNQLPKQRMI